MSKRTKTEPSMDALWKRIESALDCPVLRGLGGCSEEEIAAAEQALCYTLPEDVKASLLVKDLTQPVEGLAPFGLAHSLSRAVRCTLSYLNGPLSTRFADSGAGEPGGGTGLDGLLHFGVYEEDRTYFYLSVDLAPDHGSPVSYIDFGDLVCDPAVTLLTMSWTEYLTAIAEALESNDPPSSWFPAPQFGFGNFKRILSLFPEPRVVAVPPPASFGDAPDICIVLEEAYRNVAALPLMEKYAPPAEKELPPRPEGHTFPTPPWKAELMEHFVLDGRKAQTSEYSCDAVLDLPIALTGIDDGKQPCYIEFKLGPGTIYSVGLQSQPTKTVFISMRSAGSLHSQINTEGCMSGSQCVFDADKTHLGLTEGDVIGISISPHQLSFYHNRELSTTIKVIMRSPEKYRTGISKEDGEYRLITFPDLIYYPTVMGHTFRAEALAE